MTAALSAEQVAREDLVSFVNACFSCSGQNEFYFDALGQTVSAAFLHEYMLVNYRRLYARTLAAGVNHFNQMQIILNLLATGQRAPRDPAARAEENALLTRALLGLPTQRALKVLASLRDRRINNRRARALAREWVRQRSAPEFEAVKYRAKLRTVYRHAHLRAGGEHGRFLFSAAKKCAPFETPLFERFRQAHYSEEAIYELPFTVAEGLASSLAVPRARFLERIAPRLTSAERLRLQGSIEREGVEGEEGLRFDLGTAPLTRLAIYALSLAPEPRREREEELEAALRASARRAWERAPLRLGKVAAVLDSSYSSSGSSVKKRRPLALALASDYLLEASTREYRAFWTRPPEHRLRIGARGQTDLSSPLIAALEWDPELVVIVSDGYENDFPGATELVARAYAGMPHPGGRKAALVHVNPVFDARFFELRSLGPSIPTVGLRDAEDLPTALEFARFATGQIPLAELEAFLGRRIPT